MAALTSTVARFIGGPLGEVIEAYYQTRDDVDATNTYDITLSTVGIVPTGLLAVSAWVHTASGSIITTEAVTTSVTAGVLTITVPAGTDNDVRVFKIVGLGQTPTYTA